MQNSMWCLLFLFLIGNSLFGQIWSRKSKLLSLSWNLVPKLIRICRIQWWCSLFCFWSEMPFLGKCGPKCLNCHLRLNLLASLVRICRIIWWSLLFWFFAGSALLGEIWSIKSKLSDQAGIWKLILWKLIYIFLQNDKAAWEKLNLY